MRLFTAFVLTLSQFTAPTAGQNLQLGSEVPDMTFPAFVDGDGRQKLSEFRGQPVVVVTFADVFGGLAGAERAIKLSERYGKDGLVVIMTRIKSGGTFGDGTEGVDLGAWMMKRLPGTAVHACDVIRPTWGWSGLGMPPFYAVIGADGCLVELGSMPKSPKGITTGVEAAMLQLRRGWGEGDEATVRALLYGDGDIARAAAKAPESMQEEIDTALRQRQKIIEWLLEDGQWLRAKALTEDLRKSVGDTAGAATWQPAITDLEARFASADGELELAHDKKLQRLLRPLAKKAPADGADKGLRKLAEQAADTKVGARALRLADRVAKAAAIR